VPRLPGQTPVPLPRDDFPEQFLSPRVEENLFPGDVGHPQPDFPLLQAGSVQKSGEILVEIGRARRAEGDHDE
jgi:hypothetical protein